MEKEELLELFTRLENYTQMTLQELQSAYKMLLNLKHFRVSGDCMDNLSTDTFYGRLTEEELFYFGSWRMEDFEEGVCLYDSELTPEDIVEKLDFSFEIKAYISPNANEIILRQESDGSRTWRVPKIPNFSSKEELMEIFKNLENFREKSFHFLEEAYERLFKMNSHFKVFKVYKGEETKGSIAHNFHNKEGKFLFSFYSHHQTSFKKGVFNYKTNLKPKEILKNVEFTRDFYAFDEIGNKYFICEDSEGERNWYRN